MRILIKVGIGRRNPQSPTMAWFLLSKRKHSILRGAGGKTSMTLGQCQHCPLALSHCSIFPNPTLTPDTQSCHTRTPDRSPDPTQNSECTFHIHGLRLCSFTNTFQNRVSLRGMPNVQRSTLAIPFSPGQVLELLPLSLHQAAPSILRGQCFEISLNGKLECPGRIGKRSS